MMKKRLILILSTITIVIGSSYYVSGKLIQNNYNQALAKLAKHPDLKVSLISYSRGLFHSKATLQFDFKDKQSERADKFTLVQNITHGPIIAVSTPDGLKIKLIASKFSTHLDPEQQKLLVEYTGNSNPFFLTTVVDFSNNATTWLKIAGVDPTAPSKFNMAWATINGEFTHDLNFTNYKGFINIPKIAFNSPDSSFTLNNLTFNLDAKSQAKTYANNNKLLIKNISFSRKNQDRLKLNNIAMNLDLGIDATQKFELILSLDIESSQILQQQFAQDKITLKLSNIPSGNVPSLLLFEALSPRNATAIVEQLTNDPNSTVSLELPKHFTEALITYTSYEIYRNSMLGVIDQRAEDVVMRDITASINGLIKGALNQKLFVDQGAYYALNYVPAPLQNG